MRRLITLIAVILAAILAIGEPALATKGTAQCSTIDAIIVKKTSTYRCTKIDNSLKWVLIPHQLQISYSSPTADALVVISELIAAVNWERTKAGLKPVAECFALQRSHRRALSRHDYKGFFRPCKLKWPNPRRSNPFDCLYEYHKPTLDRRGCRRRIC